MFLRKDTRMNKKKIIQKPESKKTGSRQKKEIMVAVRMPKGLVEELHDLQKVNHFMDLSEEIRFVLRRYCFNTSTERNEKTELELQKKEQLIYDLNKIIMELKNEQ